MNIDLLDNATLKSALEALLEFVKPDRDSSFHAAADTSSGDVNEMHSFDDSAHLSQRLAEAVAWSSKCIAEDLAHSLRTHSLAPNPLEKKRAEVVLSVLRNREWLLPRKPEPIERDKQLEGGRLLCYYPDANLADAAAAVQSAGFFDNDNVPPWDTWVGLYSSGGPQSYDVYLISYVPRTFIERATAGIEVNPERCILWLSDSDTPIGNALRKQGWTF